MNKSMKLFFKIKMIKITLFLFMMFFTYSCVSTGGTNNSRTSLQKVQDNYTQYTLKKVDKSSKAYIVPIYSTLKNKQYDQAIRLSEQLKAKHPDDDELYFLQGFSYFEKRELSTALPLFEETLLLNPDRGDAHNFAALMLYKLNKAHQALKHINLAINNNKTSSQLLSFRKVLSPKTSSSIEGITGRMYFLRSLINKSLRKYNEALGDVKKAIRLSPYESSSHYTVKGDINFLKYEFDTAYNDYQKAVRINPQESDALGGMGIIDIYFGSYDKAIIHLEKAISINPKYNATLGNLGLAYWLSGNQDKAFESMGKAIRVKPVSAMYYHLGYFHHLKNNSEQARINFNKAKKLDTGLFATRAIYLDLPPNSSPTWQFYQQEYNTAKQYLGFKKQSSTSTDKTNKPELRITSLSLAPNPVKVNHPFDIKLKYQVSLSKTNNNIIPINYYYKIYQNQKKLMTSTIIALTAENNRTKSWVQHMNPVPKTGKYKLIVIIEYKKMQAQKSIELNIQ